VCPYICVAFIYVHMICVALGMFAQCNIRMGKEIFVYNCGIECRVCMGFQYVSSFDLLFCSHHMFITPKLSTAININRFEMLW